MDMVTFALSSHPCATELWKWLLQDAWADRGVYSSACFCSGEKRPPRGEEDTFLDAAELQRWPS